MQDKASCINAVRQNIGWAYSDLRWLTKGESASATEKRDKLLRSLSGKARLSFMGSKVHVGRLSPGCSACAEGYWSCLFINGLCTADCFYCPQDRRTAKKGQLPETAGVRFGAPEEYVAYLGRFKFKGVGFSGGEPFLAFDLLLAYVRKIRERFGKDMYVWVYTNGDLVDEGKLVKLKKAGLDEIRFDISARNYELFPVELASSVIDTVTVEIPAVPEDRQAVKRCLVKMQKIGVKHLSLHQLLATEYNYKNFIERGYTFIHSFGRNLPIFESEMAALELMKYALEEKIDLPIHYCSQAYKYRFQDRGRRMLKAVLVKKDFEELTDPMFIRRLSIQGSRSDINRIIRNLRENKCEPRLWSADRAGEEIFVHGSILKDIDLGASALTVAYFSPMLQQSLGSGEEGAKIKLGPKRDIFVTRQPVVRKKMASAAVINGFQKLFIEKINEQDALKAFYGNCRLRPGEDLSGMKKEADALLSLKAWERLESGFPELY